MLAGTASDRIRFEQELRKNAETYKASGDLSFTDWRNNSNEPLSSGKTLLFYRKRLNNDGTYELLDVRPDANTGLYYAKFLTLNINEESIEKHKAVLEDTLYDCGAEWDDLQSFYDDLAIDAGVAYLQELLYGYPESHFSGTNSKGNTVTKYGDCLCTEEELRAFASSLSIDLDFVVPYGTNHHFDEEHNRDLI